MKLAVNYSAVLDKLILEQPELPVDYIKVPTVPFPGCFTTQFDAGAKLRPLLPHPAQPGVLALSAPRAEERFNPEIIAELISRTAPAYLSTHLEARAAYFSECPAGQHFNSPELCAVMRERLLTATAAVKAATPIPLVLENVPYYSWPHYNCRIASEPEFICEICTAGDCGFLLDLAHARCSARTLKLTTEAYLKALPLNRLREIHLSGVREFDYGICDTHTALGKADYLLLQTVLRWAEPEIVTLEYGGMPEQIVNPFGVVKSISRNDRHELETMIRRIGKIIGK
jgi:uncharacterized protein (UPF0276 family)